MPAHQSNQPLWRFMFGSRPAEEELAYRKHYHSDDVKQIRAVGIAAIGFMSALTLQDIPNLGINPDLMSAIVIRTVVMFVAIYVCWSVGRNRSPMHADLLALGVASSVAVGMLTIHLLPGISGARIVAVGTLFIMAIHIGLPNYAAILAFPIGLAIIGDWIIIYTPGREYLREYAVLIPLVYLFAEYIAVMASAHQHRAKYHAFKRLEQVKTLSGMLPICANCKKIRDDQGYYQQIEHYITEHSEAEFTHGICPDCAKELYPDIPYPGIETEES